jgi:hypothetical protein
VAVVYGIIDQVVTHRSEIEEQAKKNGNER